MLRALPIVLLAATLPLPKMRRWLLCRIGSFIILRTVPSWACSSP